MLRNCVNKHVMHEVRDKVSSWLADQLLGLARNKVRLQLMGRVGVLVNMKVRSHIEDQVQEDCVDD